MSHDNSIHPSNVIAAEPGKSPVASRFTYASGARPLDGYIIKRGVGIGGFGEVYYATSEAGKDVALKRIQRNLDIELRGVRQCLNLKDPHLLDLYDIKYDAEGQAWVVMEYVAGDNLQQIIQRSPNGMTLEQVHHWFDGLAVGVSYLHDCGIVHRDLKPGNVFLDQDIVKIGDYGLSKFISCSRRSGQTQSVGTFHYMAPEIGRGKYGKEIDIYAMGIMLYEMLTGHVPYEGESSQEIIMKHLTAQPDLRKVPAPYRAIIERALAKDPELRFPSIGEMQQAVAGCLSGSSPALPQRTAYVAAATSSGSGTADPNSAAPVAAAGAGVILADEPIAQAVRSGLRQANRSWMALQMGAFTKAILIIVGVLVTVANAGWLIPYSVIVGIAYCVYLMVRAIVLSAFGSTTPDAAGNRVPPPSSSVQATVPDEIISAKPVPKRHVRRRLPHEMQLRAALGRRSTRDQLTDLTGSLLMSAMVSGVVGVVMLLIHRGGLQTTIYDWLPTYTWATLTSTAGAWALIILGKFWERMRGDAALRRFTMLVVGMGVGAVSYGIAQFLMVRPTYILGLDAALSETFPNALHAADGVPTFAGYMAYFGGLMVLLRWWKQTDPLRKTRLSIWSTVICVAVAVVLHVLCPFPRGFAIAVTMSLALQLSSPWLSPQARMGGAIYHA